MKTMHRSRKYRKRRNQRKHYYRWVRAALRRAPRESVLPLVDAKRVVIAAIRLLQQEQASRRKLRRHG